MHLQDAEQNGAGVNRSSRPVARIQLSQPVLVLAFSRCNSATCCFNSCNSALIAMALNCRDCVSPDQAALRDR